MENLERLSGEMMRYCEVNLKETPKKREDGIKWLQDWLDRNPSYHAHRDAYNLVRYLRACKYNHEKAVRKLDCMYTLRSAAPEWYKNRDPLLPEVQELMKLGVFLPLLQRDPEGRAIILIRATAHDPGRHLQNNVLKTGLMILDLFLNRFQDTSIYGVVAILDLKDVTLGHARQMTIPIIRKCVHSWQDCYPIRINGLHFVNSPRAINVVLGSIKQFMHQKVKQRSCYPVRIRSIDFINSPSYVNVVLNIFRKFMNPKLRKRVSKLMKVHVHGYDLSSLGKEVPLELLPPEYGGEGDTLNYLTDYWTKEVTDAREWFKEDEKYRYEADDG